MQQFENTPAGVAEDWPDNRNSRAEVAEQQKLLERSNAILAAEERERPTHRFEYDF